MDTNWTTGILKCRDAELFYTRTGGNKPAIVCAHGYTDDGTCWTDLALALEKDYDLIMYDARGHGQSSRITVDMDIDMVADTHCIISELALDKPAIIGHSMGAAVAAGYAALHPEQVSAIILEDVPWFNQPPLPKKDMKEGKPRNIIAEVQKGSLREAIALSKQYNPGFRDSVHACWASSKMKFDLTYQQRKWQETPRWQDIAAKISCPTLLITGDIEKGALVTPALAIEALKLMPKVEWSWIAGAPHCIRYERFDATMRAVKMFLKMNYPATAKK